MNAIDYFFQNSSTLSKLFLVGKEEITYKDFYSEVINLARWIQDEVGTGNNILILSDNNLFMTRAYLAVIKSGNVCIPLDPNIEKSNFRYIHDLTKP
ncbi:MAG: AMP-binding protein, partial [Bacteroidales bacterium]|nr:AMP-binding protein [Bacteroidales bacterium]